MIFRRTCTGLSNQHLFLNVDAIVFVEGGRSYSKNDVYTGQFDTHAIDIKFWRGVFSIYHKGKKLQFRAIGSKPTLKNIVDDIDKEKIRNVYVAMDRDFDDINNELRNSNGVVYTYGYSWENDVWQPEIVADVFDTVCVVDRSFINIQGMISSLYQGFAKEITTAVCADAFLSGTNTTFIPRDKHLCCLRVGRKVEPAVDKHKIRELLFHSSLTEEQVLNFGKKLHRIPLTYCYGHLLSDFCYRVIVHLMHKVSKLPSIAKHYVNCIAIDKFLRRLSRKDFLHLHKYYEASFSALY